MRGSKVVGRIGGPDRTMNKLKEQIRVLHEAVSQELDLKKNILEETAEQAAQILTRDGGNIRLELTEGEAAILKSAFEAVRQAAARGKYETSLVIGEGRALPPQELAKAQKVADKMVGLGYMTVVLTPVNENGMVTLKLNISWERD